MLAYAGGKADSLFPLILNNNLMEDVKMARMHSRDKGKAGSTKPAKKTLPTWSSYKPREVEMLVLKHAKEGKTASVTGLILRDMYGIVDVKLITKKSISQILKEKKLLKKIPEDITALIKKRINVQKHLDENHKDEAAKRGLKLTDSKINRLVKYYKKTERLPLSWKFDPKKASMFVE